VMVFENNHYLYIKILIFEIKYLKIPPKNVTLVLSTQISIGSDNALTIVNADRTVIIFLPSLSIDTAITSRAFDTCAYNNV